KGSSTSSALVYAFAGQFAGQHAADFRSPGQFSRAGTETGALEISVRPSRRKQAYLRNRRFNTAMSKSLTPNSLIRNPLIDDEPQNTKSTRSVHLSLQGKGGVGKSL